jgi:hypothetical protein
MITAFDRAKTVYVLDRAVTVIGSSLNMSLNTSHIATQLFALCSPVDESRVVIQLIRLRHSLSQLRMHHANTAGGFTARLDVPQLCLLLP